jgi:hypothetical protein
MRMYHIPHDETSVASGGQRFIGRTKPYLKNGAYQLPAIHAAVMDIPIANNHQLHYVQPKYIYRPPILRSCSSSDDDKTTSAVTTPATTASSTSSPSPSTTVSEWMHSFLWSFYSRTVS